MIKPSSSKLHLLKPFKLSLLDQLSPRLYTPFYPVAGRLKNNLFISDYDAGVPYVETRVKCRLSDLTERTRELQQELNQLLPCRPFCYIHDSDSTAPPLAVQVNVFDCGGIALAFCLVHKIIDGSTIQAFIKSWTAFSRGSDGEIPNPGLLEASSRLFPPLESVPETPNVKSLLLNGGRRKTTRSFVFDADAIATLVFKAESKSLEHPSRVLALSAFVWKHAILASGSVSGSTKPAFLLQPVNIRRRMKPQLPDYSIGNLYLMAVAAFNPTGKDIDLPELSYLVRQAVKTVSNDSQDVLQLFKTTREQLSQLVEMVSKGNAEFFILSSWLNTFDGNIDFGWGKPSLSSIPGVDGHNRELCNLIILKNARQYDAIEVWVTLSDKETTFLEQDAEFLAFVSPTPYLGTNKI
ncbi:hypothetical protein V6N11_013392 [Hibiscus sabdariffa]